MHYFNFVIFAYIMACCFGAHILPARYFYDNNRNEKTGYAAYIQPIYTVMTVPNEAAAYVGAASVTGSAGKVFDKDTLKLASLAFKLPNPSSTISVHH